MASIFSIEVEDVTCEHGMDMYCAAYIHVEHLILSDLCEQEGGDREEGHGNVVEKAGLCDTLTCVVQDLEARSGQCHCSRRFSDPAAPKAQTDRHAQTQQQLHAASNTAQHNQTSTFIAFAVSYHLYYVVHPASSL